MKFTRANEIETRANGVIKDMERLKKLIHKSHLIEAARESGITSATVYLKGLPDLAISNDMVFTPEDFAPYLADIISDVDAEINSIKAKYNLLPVTSPQ